MRKLGIITFVVILIITACKKDEKDVVNNNNPVVDTDVYSSKADFYAKNTIKAESFSSESDRGGSYTTSNGTTVNILPNTFVDRFGNDATGVITIEFIDLYKKSDMLLSDMPPVLNWNKYNRNSGPLMKSAGEFFIRAKNSSGVLDLKPNMPIIVTQPSNGLPIDTAMKPFMIGNDSTGTLSGGWSYTPYDSLEYNTSQYVFSLYNFSSPLDSGTWCNSDNPNYFQSYHQRLISIHPVDSQSTYDMDVFLVYKGINAMVHVYRDMSTLDFDYYYAPEGLPYTIVAIGVKNNHLYAAFKEINAGFFQEQFLTFTLSRITTKEFKTKLKLLDN